MNVKNKKNVSLSSSSFLKTRSKFLPFVRFSIRLEVHFAPHVSLTSDRGELLQEGDPVRFVCSASANPAQMNYAWYIGGKRVATRQDGADTELVLEHVDRRLHNQAIRCEVTNPIGRTEKSAVLNIACKKPCLIFSIFEINLTCLDLINISE